MGAGRSLKVLVAEDNPFIADLVRQGLSSAVRRRMAGMVEIAFESASDGVEALAKLEKDPYDLVICDVMMPILDGAELIRRVRANPKMRPTKILAMSAAGPQAEQDALAAGADFFLDKPIQLSMLVEALTALLGL
jgi:CheY-like chemotaxis protein